jgi:hypothetical protein
MNGKWIEVFRTGSHTDMNGNVREWSEEDLDQIVEKYNTGEHEAPLVIGHPEINAPAYGWVKQLRRSGEILEALTDNVDPAFEEAVRSGKFKKRSISLYPNLTLRHIGFLGAVPPAVKGLKDVPFAAADEAMTIDFASTTINKESPTMDEKEKKDLLDQIAARDAKIASFSDQMTALQTQLNTVSSALESERQTRREGTLESFCDALVSGTHITPAQKPAALELMRVLDTNGEHNFADGTKDPVEAFTSFMKTMPKQIEFGEHATHGRAGGRRTSNTSQFGENVDADRMAIHDEAVALSNEQKISYADAVIQIMNKGE